jgi:hypothetical protein
MPQELKMQNFIDEEGRENKQERLSLTRFFLQIYYLRLMQVAYLLRNLNSLV